jgi:hypothetical protein
MPLESDSSPKRVPSAEHWVSDVYANPQVNVAVSENFDPLGLLDLVENGGLLSEHLEAAHEESEGVSTKNKFLGFLAELSEGDSHIGDLLGLMDNQAQTMAPARETSYRQFMGLWDLAVALSKDKTLLDQLAEQD